MPGKVASDSRHRLLKSTWEGNFVISVIEKSFPRTVPGEFPRTLKLARGTDRCRCPTCSEHFHSVGAFDRHRSGSVEPLARRCLDPDEMRAAGMVTRPDGFWITGRTGVYSPHVRLPRRDSRDPLSGGAHGRVAAMTARPDWARPGCRIFWGCREAYIAEVEPDSTVIVQLTRKDSFTRYRLTPAEADQQLRVGVLREFPPRKATTPAKHRGRLGRNAFESPPRASP